MTAEPFVSPLPRPSVGLRALNVSVPLVAPEAYRMPQFRQALAFWAVWFKVESPSELGDKITTDADFIGSKSNARALNEQLHWTMWTPSLDDSTPQTAKLTKRVDHNGVKQIDFLHSIVGLDSKEIRKRAVAINLPPSSKISILHPVDVLTSRLKNLQHLPEKQKRAWRSSGASCY